MMQQFPPTGTTQTLDAALPRAQKVVLVMDLVESVRMMEGDEAGVISRWRHFVQQAREQVLPACAGRLVKSLGDGIMVEFEDARQAVQAAAQLHRLLEPVNEHLGASQKMAMRAGIHATHVYVDDSDIYGAGVNLAARIATLAGPGETVVSASARDSLADGLDADFEDLGECYLKHIAEPVRVYRAGAAGPRPVLSGQQDYAGSLQPAVAVIPFESRSRESELLAIGELIADGVITQLSRTPELRVISRLSSTLFRARPGAVDDVQRHLGADYALRGSYAAVGGKLLVMADLVETRNGETIWAERLQSTVDDLLSVDSQTLQTLTAGAHDAILRRAAQAARARPLPTLSGYALMLGGIAMTHRTSRGDFFRAHDIFEHLAERYRRHAELPAWLAKWHVLQVAQGWSGDVAASTRQALAQSSKALDLDPESALALTIDGFVRADLLKDFDGAMGRYDAAIQANPSESTAWLFKGLLQGFRGEGAQAVQSVDRALQLSPLDPARYFFDTLAASVYLSAGDHARAIALAQRSLRANATHVSSYRTLVIAQALHGQVEQARATAVQLLKLDPAFSVTRFLARRSGGPFGEFTRSFAEALRSAGVPE